MLQLHMYLKAIADESEIVLFNATNPERDTKL